jgi:hypothetical protein
VIALRPPDRLAESLPQPPIAAPESALPAPEIAPAPRLVNRLPLASAEQLAASRKQAMEQMVQWVRVNNRWSPDAEIATKAAAQVAQLPAKVDGLVIAFGGGLLKSQTPTLVSARTGSFFVFELSPEQERAAALKPMGQWILTHSHAPDARRATPGVRLSDLRIDEAGAHAPGGRINGSITCEFPTAPARDDHLQITHYRPDGRRVMFLHHPKQSPQAGRVTLRFSANALEQRSAKDERLVIVFAEWVSERDGARVIESNTEAALLLVAERP